MMVDMYLVHVTLRPRDGGRSRPPDCLRLIWSQVVPDDHIEHVVVHHDAYLGLVIGLYVMADRLDTAKTRAERVCRRAIESLAPPQGWDIALVAAPSIVPLPEWPQYPNA